MAAERERRRADVTVVELIGGVERRELVLAAYDDSWPATFAEHEARIRGRLGSAVRVEHIGSTSVPAWPPSRSSTCWSSSTTSRLRRTTSAR